MGPLYLEMSDKTAFAFKNVYQFSHISGNLCPNNIYVLSGAFNATCKQQNWHWNQKKAADNYSGQCTCLTFHPTFDYFSSDINVLSLSQQKHNSVEKTVLEEALLSAELAIVCGHCTQKKCAVQL